MNKRIYQEIMARLGNAQNMLPNLPSMVHPVWEAFEAQQPEHLANELVPQLRNAFKIWADPKYTGAPEGARLQAAGFEWYYDGSAWPDVLGYGYTLAVASPELVDPSIRNISHLASDDFGGGVELDDCVFCDSGGFDIGIVCAPLYEQVIDIGIGSIEELTEAVDALINLYMLRVYQCLHLAMYDSIRSEEFSNLQRKTPFLFLANNHDWSPFLLFEVA